MQKSQIELSHHLVNLSLHTHFLSIQLDTGDRNENTRRNKVVSPLPQRTNNLSGKKNQVRPKQNTIGAYKKVLTNWEHVQVHTLPDSV